jgi:carbamoyl-phosphate synthase large subunit
LRTILKRPPAFSKNLANKWGYPIIIQEYIRGSEYNVVALGDGEGGMTGAVPMKKLYITDKGKGWSGVTITEPALLEISQKVISKISWKSGMELEFMKSETTGEYYLLEINPRFPCLGISGSGSRAKPSRGNGKNGVW